MEPLPLCSYSVRERIIKEAGIILITLLHCNINTLFFFSLLLLSLTLAHTHTHTCAFTPPALEWRLQRIDTRMNSSKLLTPLQFRSNRSNAVVVIRCVREHTGIQCMPSSTQTQLKHWDHISQLHNCVCACLHGTAFVFLTCVCVCDRRCVHYETLWNCLHCDQVCSWK